MAALMDVGYNGPVCVEVEDRATRARWRTASGRCGSASGSWSRGWDSGSRGVNGYPVALKPATRRHADKFQPRSVHEVWAKIWHSSVFDRVDPLVNPLIGCVPEARAKAQVVEDGSTLPSLQ